MNKNQFEIPEQFRQMAEKNVEMASNAYSQMMDSMVNAMGMWTSSMPDNPAMAGFKPLQDKAIEFANKNSEAGLKLAKDIAAAKDIQEVLQLQSKFAQSQMQAYSLQAQELGHLMTQAAQSGLKSGG